MKIAMVLRGQPRLLEKRGTLSRRMERAKLY
jgi:hypothetical protein